MSADPLPVEERPEPMCGGRRAGDPGRPWRGGFAIPGGEGKKFFVPLNVALTNGNGQLNNNGRGTPLREMDAIAEICRDAMDRIALRLRRYALRHRKEPATWKDVLAEFRQRHHAYLCDTLSGVCNLVAAYYGAEIVAEEIAQRICDQWLEQLGDASDANIEVFTRFARQWKGTQVTDQILAAVRKQVTAHGNGQDCPVESLALTSSAS